MTAHFGRAKVAGLAATLPTQAQPTEPMGGKPPADAKPSFTDFETFKDQVLYRRAFEAVLWSVPMVNKRGLRRGTLAIGGDENVVLAWSAGATPLFEALTPNNVSPYVLAMTDLRKGPVVLEIPPANDKAAMFGQLADHWYQTFVDIGPIGVDKGKGAKLLLTPPGYSDQIPDGYIQVKSPSFRPDMAIRSIPTPAGTPADAEALGKQMKMYYLSELPNPQPTKFMDPLNTQWPTLARYDERWFEDLHEVISIEPSQPRDMVMMGMLKTIGIEAGKPYAPNDKTKAIYRQAVTDAYHYMQETFAQELPGEAWWSDRQWRDIFFADVNRSFKWETTNPDLVDYDMRAVRPWFSAIYFPAKVAEKPATMYLGPLHQAGWKQIGVPHRARTPMQCSGFMALKTVSMTSRSSWMTSGNTSENTDHGHVNCRQVYHVSCYVDDDLHVRWRDGPAWVNDNNLRVFRPAPMRTKRALKGMFC